MNTWRTPEVEGRAPCARNSHTAQAVEIRGQTGRIIIFGGSCPERGPMNDTYELLVRGWHSHLRVDALTDANPGTDSCHLTWNKIDCIGDMPSPRELHAACILDDSSIVVSGGRHTSQVFDDCYKLYLSTSVYQFLLRFLFA